jgi:hypothetical protein
MSSMRSGFLVATVALLAAAVLASSATASSSQVVRSSVSCSSSYVSAKLSWGLKCLRAGEPCKVANVEYHRYGFTCPSSRRLARFGGASLQPRTSATSSAPNCSPSYVGACLDPNASDYDCAGGSGDGPYYTGPVKVVGPDVFGLDRDGDGYACE